MKSHDLVALHLLAQEPCQASRLVLAAHGLPQPPDFSALAEALRRVSALSAPARQSADKELRKHFKDVKIPQGVPLSAYSQIAVTLFRLLPAGRRGAVAGLGIRPLSLLVGQLPPENATRLRAALLPVVESQLVPEPVRGAELLSPAGLLWHCVSRRILDYHEALRIFEEPRPKLAWDTMAHEMCWTLNLISN